MGKWGRVAFAYLLAFLLFRIFKLRRKLVIKNIETAFGDFYSKKEQTRIAFLSYFNFLQTIFEFLGAIDGKLADHVEIENAEYLDELLKRGQGVFILCCHMGSWEAMGGAYNRRFGPTHVIVKKVGNDNSDRFVREQRLKNDFRFIDRSGGKGSATKAILKAIRKGEMIGFVMDQSRPGEPYLPFFNKPAKTNTGLGYFAIKSGAPVVASYAHRVAPGKHKVFIGKEIELPTEGTEDERVLESARRFNIEVEKVIRTCPEQYFWMHNRWK